MPAARAQPSGGRALRDDLLAAGIEPSAELSSRSPAAVAAEFRRLLDDGVPMRCVGRAKRRPTRLLELGYTPKQRVDLFDTRFYLSRVRQNPDIRFFVAYVTPGGATGRPRRIHPRIFYKDISLIWRSASHFVRSESENWIGKGDLKTVIENGEPVPYSSEETTDLPLEIQSALEAASRSVRRVQRDDVAIEWVLRHGGPSRVVAFSDFTGPRRRAAADPRRQINRGRSIARFTRKGDPTSLRFARGYEPDFRGGVVETAESSSRMYGGRLRRFRIVSANRQVQYLFFAGPRHVWIIPAQATSRELTSYGVRPVDVVADEDLFLPGYEYHFLDDYEDPPELVSQIPEGFAGAPSEVDPSRADASAWIDRLPIVRKFRREVLGVGRGRR